MTTETHHLDMATMGRDNSLGTIVTTMDSSVIALPTKIVQITPTTGIRIKIETSFGIILITTIDEEKRAIIGNIVYSSFIGEERI